MKHFPSPGYIMTLTIACLLMLCLFSFIIYFTWPIFTHLSRATSQFTFTVIRCLSGHLQIVCQTFLSVSKAVGKKTHHKLCHSLLKLYTYISASSTRFWILWDRSHVIFIFVSFVSNNFINKQIIKSDQSSFVTAFF